MHGPSHFWSYVFGVAPAFVRPLPFSTYMCTVCANVALFDGSQVPISSAAFPRLNRTNSFSTIVCTVLSVALPICTHVGPTFDRIPICFTSYNPPVLSFIVLCFPCARSLASVREPPMPSHLVHIPTLASDASDFPQLKTAQLALIWFNLT